jgi:hypothetical protein
MDDKLQENQGSIEDFPVVEMEEAILQVLFKVYRREEFLQEDQPSERGEGLIFKLDIGQRMGFTLNVRFARFHNEPPCVMILIGQNIIHEEVLFAHKLVKELICFLLSVPTIHFIISDYLTCLRFHLGLKQRSTQQNA